MITLQKWLDDKYPTQKAKEGVKKIDISVINKERKNQGIDEELEGGELDLSKYARLEEINLNGYNLKSYLTKLILGEQLYLHNIWCAHNKLTSLTLNCPTLTYLYCYENKLTNLDFLNGLNPKKLTTLRLDKNNFSIQDLNYFREFINLEDLNINNNRFVGTLEPLKDLTKLRYLHIENTDLDSGLEYLPNNIALFYCSTVKMLGQELRQHGEPEGNEFSKLLKTWRLANSSLVTNAKLNLKELEEKKNKLIKEIEDQRQANALVKLWYWNWPSIVQEELKKVNWEIDKKKLASQKRKIFSLEKELKIKNPRLTNQAKQIEKLQKELATERETNQASAEAMDNFYRQQFIEDKDPERVIYKNFSEEYLKINLENKQLKAEIQELKEKLKAVEKLFREDKKEEISEAINKKQNKLAELQKKLNNLKSEEQQIQSCQIQQADFSFNLKK